MPELPEVETIRRDLSRLIVGRKILGIEADSSKQVQPSLKVVEKAVVGKRIVGIGRKAKLLVIALSNGSDGKRATQKARKGNAKGAKSFLAVHLKLTGRLLVRKKSDKKDDWQRVTIKLKAQSVKRKTDEELELRFCDLRKFGWIRLVTKQELGIMNQELGVEPLTKEFTLGYFREVLASTGRAVKIVLMDQKKISGVGNIYANEALFLARIDPRRPAKKIVEKGVKALYQAIEKVLKAGIKYRGASDQYYLDALGRKGSYQDHFLIYGRNGEKCFDCQGEIRRVKLGGRGTFFCPKCQR